MLGMTHTCTIQRRYQKQKLTFTGGTGTPTVGQTVTGGSSDATAEISEIGSGYLIVIDVDGAFTPTETITTTTWSGTLGTQTGYANSQGEKLYYWMDDQTAVPCRFYSPGKSPVVLNHETGTFVPKPLHILLPPTVTIAEVTYRITTTATGFTGTYTIDPAIPRSKVSGVQHYEAALTKEPNP